MAGEIKERKIDAFQDDEPLCCNFSTWQDGSITCDMMVGDKVRQQLAGIDTYVFSSTYTFQSNDFYESIEVIPDIDDSSFKIYGTDDVN